MGLKGAQAWTNSELRFQLCRNMLKQKNFGRFLFMTKTHKEYPVYEDIYFHLTSIAELPEYFLYLKASMSAVGIPTPGLYEIQNDYVNISAKF